MCIIIVKKHEGQTISTQQLKAALKNNPDGVGLMYYDQAGKLKIYKTDKPRIREILALTSELRSYAIHFRLATHGDITTENCHPFTFGGNSRALMHNGILPNAHRLSDNHRITDTQGYINEYLEPLIAKDKKTNIDWQAIGMHIKQYNKFVVAEKGHLVIVNEDSGISYKGNWYSNAGAFNAVELAEIYQRPEYTTSRLYSPGFADRRPTFKANEARKIKNVDKETSFYTSLAYTLEDWTNQDTEFFTDAELLDLVAQCMGYESAYDCLENNDYNDYSNLDGITDSQYYIY